MNAGLERGVTVAVALAIAVLAVAVGVRGRGESGHTPQGDPNTSGRPTSSTSEPTSRAAPPVPSTAGVRPAVPAPGIPAASSTASATHAIAAGHARTPTTARQAPETPATASTGGVAASACTAVATSTQQVVCGQDGSAVCGTYQTPAPLFGTLSGWRCSVEVGSGASLALYTVQHSCAGLAQAMTCRQETVAQGSELLAADGCPAPITGTISGLGNRIPLTVRIVGPSGTRTISAILDTGGVDTQIPNADMLAVGLTPTTETTARWPLVSTAPVQEWTYTASYPEVYDNGAWVPLGLGTTTLYGADIPAGMSPLIGPDVLKAGTRLATDGSAFTLTPPCPGTKTA